jgi:transcription antitermination factor NusG
MVSLLLSYKGYETFLPVYRKQRTNRRHSEDMPWFPGYVFCRIAPEANGLIVTTPGVVGLVGVARQPQPVLESEMENLRRLGESGLAVRPHPAYEVGACVRLIAGPLKGCCGIVRSMPGNTCLVVSVELLMRSVAVTIDPEWVHHIDEVTYWTAVQAASGR